MFSSVRSLKGNTCGQVFTNGRFTYVCPMKSKRHAGDALQSFVDDVGIPSDMVSDLAGEQVGENSKFFKRARELKIRMRHTEARTPKQNRCKAEIGTLKRLWRSRMTRNHIPRRLWDYGLVYEAEILSRTARGPEGRTGIEELTGDSVDISEWMDFAFYDLVWFWHYPHPDVASPGRELGRWLGVSHRIGSNLCYWILTKKGNVLAQTTVQHVTKEDMSVEETRQRIRAFTSNLNARLVDDGYTTNEGEPFWLEDEVEIERPLVMNPDGNMEPYLGDKDDILPEPTPEAYDQYLSAQLLVPKGGELVQGTVVKRLRGPDGQPIGTKHNNPLLDTREYEVRLSDGTVESYTANIIVENIYSQADSEGHYHNVLLEIIDHQANNSAVSKDDGYTVSSNGNRVPKVTTKGWRLCVT
ncbi:hypothetical protein ACA910_017625 [Epithemia clementina (nom. ined.)]